MMTTGKIFRRSALTALGAAVLTVLVGIVGDVLVGSSHGALTALITLVAFMTAPYVAGGVFLLTLVVLLVRNAARGRRG
ncbi:hypothetical protein [Archangium sp.]|uniref:hypothetical protein n=1 Tax=Archangium sp. TaxID=1872627 RepID=UPI00286BCE9A|nr:hypothetical protein [Archangium sp.]